ncbi:MAG: hypothetical protein AB1490_11805 [Pseudomonadota bacterium]
MRAVKDTLLALYKLRAEIEEFADRIIALLDRIDAPEEELEDVDEDDDRECEPSLGATGGADQRRSWRSGPYPFAPDLEAECPCLCGCLCCG